MEKPDTYTELKEKGFLYDGDIKLDELAKELDA